MFFHRRSKQAAHHRCLPSGLPMQGPFHDSMGTERCMQAIPCDMSVWCSSSSYCVVRTSFGYFVRVSCYGGNLLVFVYCTG
jgi:hypothetical protein